MSDPKVLSVNVGRPRQVDWRGDSVATSIYKVPVEGRVTVGRLNLLGDQQADLSVHGGPDKAIYAYPTEHYGFWHEELPGVALPWGAFGENLSTEGLLEQAMRIGDRLHIGTAEFVVTQPRLPCFKLNARFQRPDMVKRFLRSGRTGFYLAVLQEGEVAAGDGIDRIPTAEPAVTVAEVAALYTADAGNRDLMERAVRTAGLPLSWRDHFRTRLRKAEA
jgi:MOSC domain-containing protein YiiM